MLFGIRNSPGFPHFYAAQQRILGKTRHLLQPKDAGPREGEDRQTGLAAAASESQFLTTGMDL